LLLALTRQANPLPKKRYYNVKEPDPFSGGSPDELCVFIFQCQIYFHACRREFSKDTKKVFFAIFYLRGVALDYFKPFINKSDPYQGFDFLENWSAFVQKLSNVFGSYFPENNDEDAIVVIPFPNDGKAVSYFIQFAKYQNHIHWDDRSLRKVVKDALPSHIRDKLRFSHKDLSSFKGLKRAILKIDNDFWKCHQEDKNKLQTLYTLQGYVLRTSRPELGQASSSLERLAILDQVLREGIKLSTPLTFPSCLENPSPLLGNILGSNG